MRIKLSNLFSNNNFNIWLVLLAAVFLRFFNFFEIPYTFDELSALNRTTYDSFNELINKGILNDGHPGLIQVFLYYWVRFFSYSESIVKLPFLLCGLLSVWLVFLIGKKWFSATTGLLSASFIACIQFTVMYSQIARPYATGLCFLLLFVYFWSNTVIEKRNNLLHWIGFSIAAALCAYNHYFSLFSALLVAISGLFFVSGKQFLKYLLFCFFAILLFLPHYKITLHQFSLGGLNWLPVPQISFFWNYFEFIFHYSSLFIFLFVAIIVSGLFFHLKYANEFPRRSLFILAIIWFILPILTGYLYSVYAKPVLQFSVLIFSLPFLFISAFAFFPSLKPKLNTILILLVFSVTIPTLIYGRQYFRFFYNQGYDAIAKNQIALLDSLKQPVSLMINGYEPLFLQYHSFKYDHEIPCDLYVFDNFNNVQFNSYIKKLKPDYIAIAHAGVMPLHYFDMVQTENPYFVKKSVGSGYEWYVFSRIIQKDRSQFYFTSTLKFDAKAFFGKYNPENISTDPNDTIEKVYKYNDGDEWGPEFKATMKELNCGHHDLIHISADIYTENSEANLVFTLKNTDDSLLTWQSVSVQDFPVQQNKWRKVYLTLRLTDFEMNSDSIIMQTYIWNKSKSSLLLDNFSLKLEKGNPFIYSMFYDF